MAEVGKIWYCKIGEAQPVMQGADLPMREAVATMFKTLTGVAPEFIFSGWGAKLDERERAVVEDRMPDLEKAILERDKIIALIEEGIKILKPPVQLGQPTPAGWHEYSIRLINTLPEIARALKEADNA